MAMLQQTTPLFWSSVSCPMGECFMLATERGVCWVGTPGTSIDKGLDWARKQLHREHATMTTSYAPLVQAADELKCYFAGEKINFSCSLDLYGTPFQQAVWRELTRIPYGETRSYSEIARIIGRPSASRAVGAANGANPIAIIVPCHRVIGSSGALTGYGGGLPTKAWLLKLEGTTA